MGTIAALLLTAAGAATGPAIVSQAGHGIQVSATANVTVEIIRAERIGSEPPANDTLHRQRRLVGGGVLIEFN